MTHIVRLLLDKPWLIAVAVVAFFILAVVFENYEYEYDIFEFLKKCCGGISLAFLVLGIFFLPTSFSAAQRPVSNNEWVEIYENNLDATVELEYQDYGDHYHSVFAGSHDESLKDLSDTATRNKVVRSIKLTVKKDYNEIQKIVVLDKNNIIQNYDDLNNVKIAKVEYRKIDGLAREFFGVYGSPKTADEVGEIRITLESSEDQELRKVFGQ